MERRVPCSLPRAFASVGGQGVGYVILADFIVAIHVAFMVYVVFGQLLILIGVVAKQGWVRNIWFRCSHLGAIFIVAFETVADIPVR